MSVRRVDYDSVAEAYDQRYRRNEYRGIERAVLEFTAGIPHGALLEVGCGTGHWLALLLPRIAQVVGLDRSGEMLRQARSALPDAPLVQGRAESLPLHTASVDRILCVNALHHFTDPPAFFAEARRVLRPGGGVCTVGLDPHTGRDRWWIYDYFPEAIAADRERYPAAARIRELMTGAGFAACETREVQHVPAERTVSVAIEQGLLDRRSTSQLMVISDAAYAAGVARIRAAAAAGNDEPVLRADLRVYATSGWLRSG